MKTTAIRSRLLLLLIPFMFTGCYTQFQTYEQFPLEGDRYSGYYSWDGFEEGQASQRQQNQSEVTQLNDEAVGGGVEDGIEDELQLEMNDIYYVDYETKRWYEEHYANKLFWEGYREGYADGFYDGYTGYYPNSARYSINRHRYLYGYTGAFEYFGFYHNPFYSNSFWFGLGFMPYNSFYVGYNGFYGHGYNPYYYDSYWGHPYYSFYNYGYAYNNYYRNVKYSRNTDLYRKGPRNNGLTNYDGTRTRSDLTSVNRRNSTVDRTRSTTDLNRSRTNSTGVRNTNTPRINTRSTTTSGRSVTRTRGNTSTKTRSSSGSSKRTRGSDSYISRNTDIRTNTVGTRDRTYTIPARKVSTINRNTGKRSGGYFSVSDFFKTIQRSAYNGSYDHSKRSSSNWNSGYTNTRNSSGSVTRRSSGSNINRSTNSSSTRTKVSRSSSSSSSRSRGTSSSSSSSKKRSRGGN